MSQLYRLLPSVDAAIKELETVPGLAAAPRPMLRDAVNEFLDLCRAAIAEGRLAGAASLASEILMPRLHAYAGQRLRPHFRRVINATGVVVHTNLGRSLLAPAAAEAALVASLHYSNLEFDLDKGERGSRYSHVEELLCRLTGAEAALVVNNNAAAVLLTLETLAKGREVIVSRGQLVEIGGSFRIPEVMAKSGAILREVGATNRTHVRDYAGAIGPETAALMRVHTSNYRIIGFTKEVTLPEMALLGREHELPVIEDLGSGNFVDFTALGLGYEPTVQQVVAEGADVVTFSGDKVLGGPQAGIIVGRKELLERIKKNPLNRALRIDKMTLAALEATLRIYADPERARREIPTLAMILAEPKELTAKARRLAARIRKQAGDAFTVRLKPGASRVGGGAFPERDLPTTLVALTPTGRDVTPETLRAALLAADPPLIGRIEDGAFCLDPRTVFPGEFAQAAEVLAQAATPATTETF
ncbi:MAG: L-seryl-tRNA(Sec) selenium transferase [Desulfovibrionaceae bacterium]|nr:L-seryl-tRNA(Sec) selenium transferase [Desulfovibrionaceae bacterium]MBF0514187.1 L-seryl-tRNA(Sec) selenium transferase [Desulfovibrionaceae bacterium]